MDIKSRIQAAAQAFLGSNTKEFQGDWVTITGTDDAVNERNLLENNKEWVYIAIDRIAASVTSVSVKVMRTKRNDNDEEVFEGPLYDFLEMPGPGLTGKDFIYLNTVYKELTGNAFWERLKENKLTPIVPTRVRPVFNGNNMTGYEVYDGSQPRKLSRDQLLHDRYIDPAKPYWGAGKLHKIARWVDTSSFANEFMRRFFLNGAHFGGFIETEEESEERIKMIKAGLHNDHVGVGNAHKWGVLPKGSKAQRMTANMNEIEMGATDDRYRDKILAGFGVPKSIVGLVEDVNRANAEANEYTFAKYTVKPIIEDLIEFLNVHVAKRLDPSGQFYFDYEEFVPENMEIALQERKTALAGQSYKTVNEVRSEIGLPPVDGGDAVYGPPFQTPLGDAQPHPEPVDPAGGNDPDTEPVPAKQQKQHARSARTRANTFKKHEKVKETITDDITDALKNVLDDMQDKDPDEIAHKSFVGRVENYLDRVAEAVRVFNSEQRQRVLNDLKRITKSQKAVSKSDLFDADAEVAVMVNFVQPLLRGLLTEQALAEFAAQGFDGTFDSGAAILAQTVDHASKRLAKTYNNTTAKLLKKALNEGITEGEGLADLTKRVQDIYEFSDTHRAKAVAHTESFYIANKGNQEAYRQSGVVKAKRWYTAEDERVCQFCMPMHGKIVGVNESYFAKGEVMTGSQGGHLALDYRAMDVPPLHTNCRCFIRPANISID